LNQRQTKIDQDKAGLIRGKSVLKKAKTGLDAYSMVDNLRKGEYLEGSEGLLGIVKEYLPDNSGKIKALDATAKLLAETSGGKKSINKKFGKEMARLSEYSNKLKRAQSLSKGIDTSLKAIGHIKKAKELINKAIGYQNKLRALKDDGTTSKAGRDLIMGMDATGEAIKQLAQYLPPGASDFVEFYSDAMKLPGTVNKVGKKWYKDRDEAVNVSGPLAQTKAGREYDGILDRDPELNPDGSLGVYHDPEKNRYVLITDPDKPAITISKKERDRLAQINSDLTASGKKLTNSIIQKLRENGYQSIVIPGIFGDEVISVKDLAKLADKKRDEARIKVLTSRAMGIKNPSEKDLKDYKFFDDKLKFSQRFHNYHLTDKQKKRLFASFQNDPEGFDKFLSNYEQKNKNTGSNPQLTHAQKDKKAAEELAIKAGMHPEDIRPFLNCMCRNCGGMLGGGYNPDFETDIGHGPCQCRGPLTIWKTPLPVKDKDRQYECFNQVTKMRYDQAQGVFNKWRQQMVEANAQSARKQVKQIEASIAEGDYMGAADAFNAISDLIQDYMATKFYEGKPKGYNLSNRLAHTILEGLRVQAKAHAEDLEMKKPLNTAVKKMAKACTLNLNTAWCEKEQAKYGTWEQNWNDVTSKEVPDVANLLNNGKISTASTALQSIHDRINKQLLPPRHNDPALVSLHNLLKEVQKQQKDALNKMAEGQAQWKNGLLGKALSTLKEAAVIDLSNKKIAKVLKGMQSQKKIMDDALLQADKLIGRKKLKQAQNALKKAGRIGNKYKPYIKMVKNLKHAMVELSQSPKPGDLAYAESFAGKWNSTYGVMTLTVQGFHVSGNYTHDKGRIEAALSEDGKTMTGTWAEFPSYKGSRDAGKMYFKLSSDAKKIDGLWSYGDAVPTSNWTATRIVDAQPQPLDTKIVAGKTRTSTSYTPNNKGDVFKGGHWAGGQWRQRLAGNRFSNTAIGYRCLHR